MADFVKVNAGNDVNGNPRRAWVRVDSRLGRISRVYLEGYIGLHAVPEDEREDARFAPVLEITAAEYRRLRKIAARNGSE